MIAFCGFEKQIHPCDICVSAGTKSYPTGDAIENGFLQALDHERYPTKWKAKQQEYDEQYPAFDFHAFRDNRRSFMGADWTFSGH